MKAWFNFFSPPGGINSKATNVLFLLNTRAWVNLAHISAFLNISDLGSGSSQGLHVTQSVPGDFSHSVFELCFVDQTSTDKMVIAILKTCVSGVLVFSFCTAGIVKITDKVAPQVYEQMVSCLGSCNLLMS